MNEKAPRKRSYFVLGALLALGCRSGPQLFEDVASRNGIEFISYSGDHLWYLVDTLGSGAAAGDYDGDGDPDLLLLTGGAILDEYQEEAAEYSNALLRNDGGGRFTDVTERAGLRFSGWSNGAVFGDYDGDGDLDLYVVCHGPNLLYRNEGNGTFTEVGRQAGVAHEGFGAGACFADFDGDRDLDLFVTNYAKYDLAAEKGKVKWFTDGVKQFPQYFEPQDDVLYRNNGDGTFTDITLEAGAAGTGRGMTAMATDYDDDGDLDLAIVNDIGYDDLLRNDGGRFTDVSFESGFACNREGQYEAGMGLAANDYDGDGDIDFIVTNYGGEQNTLFRNEGGGQLLDVTREVGLRTQLVMDCVGWGVAMQDFDLDGNVDILVVNGHVIPGIIAWYMKNLHDPTGDIPQMGPEAFRQGASQPKHLFLGKGDGTFEDLEGRAGYEIESGRMSRGSVHADFDGDGRLDLAVVNKNEEAQILLNRMPPRGSWVVLDLRAPPPNVFAIGARVTIRAGGRSFTRELHAGSSYLSCDEPAVHTGLGAAQRIDQVIVRWPGGPTETFRGLPVNRRMTLRQGDSTVPQPEPQPVPAPVDPPLLPEARVTPASASAGS